MGYVPVSGSLVEEKEREKVLNTDSVSLSNLLLSLSITFVRSSQSFMRRRVDKGEGWHVYARV